MIDDNLCPRCGTAVETAYHRYWECPDNEHIENQIAMRASEYMRETAPKESAQLTRGIPPKSAYPKIKPPPGSYWNPEIGKEVSNGAISSDKNGIVIFTDGSGGKEGSDVRLRRCGWAFNSDGGWNT